MKEIHFAITQIFLFLKQWQTNFYSRAHMCCFGVCVLGGEGNCVSYWLAQDSFLDFCPKASLPTKK